MRIAQSALISLLVASPVMGESHDPFAPTGDVAKGEKAFKKCIACHVVRDPDGNTLAGRKGKSGPNLYGLAGGTAGTVEGYKYGKSMIAAGQGSEDFAPLIWNEETFVGYVQDPKAFLRDYMQDPKARAKMTLRVRKEEDAVNLYAFLHSLAPPAPAEEPADASEETASEEATREEASGESN